MDAVGEVLAERRASEIVPWGIGATRWRSSSTAPSRRPWSSRRSTTRSVSSRRAPSTCAWCRPALQRRQHAAAPAPEEAAGEAQDHQAARRASPPPSVCQGPAPSDQGEETRRRSRGSVRSGPSEAAQPARPPLPGRPSSAHARDGRRRRDGRQRRGRRTTFDQPDFNYLVLRRADARHDRHELVQARGVRADLADDPFPRSSGTGRSPTPDRALERPALRGPRRARAAVMASSPAAAAAAGVRRAVSRRPPHLRMRTGEHHA